MISKSSTVVLKKPLILNFGNLAKDYEWLLLNKLTSFEYFGLSL